MKKIGIAAAVAVLGWCAVARAQFDFPPQILVSPTGTQTLSNKTLSAPVISGTMTSASGNSLNRTSGQTTVGTPAFADDTSTNYRTSGDIAYRWRTNAVDYLTLSPVSTGVNLTGWDSAGSLAAQLRLTSGGILFNIALGPTTDGGVTLGLPTLRFKRMFFTGTAPVAGDLVLSAAWGSTASVGTISGDDTHLQFVVTSAGTGQAAGATVTYTFKDGTWTNAPRCYVEFVTASTAADLTAQHFSVTSTTATTMVITVQPNAPVATRTYTLRTLCVGA